MPEETITIVRQVIFLCFDIRCKKKLKAVFPPQRKTPDFKHNMLKDSLYLDCFSSPWIEDDLKRSGMKSERQLEVAKNESPFMIMGLLKSCAAKKDLCRGSRLHAFVRDHQLLEKNAYIGSALISMYAKCGALSMAQQMLEELPVRNVVSWSALIAGYAQNGQGEEALKCFDDMLSEGHSADAVTFGCALKACGSIRATAKGEEIHNKIVSLGMLEKDIILANALVDMYAKCGALEKAQGVLKELLLRDVITWSALIAGYVHHGQGEEALKCFDEMLSEGHSPTAVTFVSVLKSCGNIGAAAKGKEIHDKIVILGMLEKDIILGNALVDMYVQCGALAKAQQVLEEILQRNVITWSTLIAGYVQQGQGDEALKCFDDMLREGHVPNAVTFVCVLKACGSIGAASKGEKIHDKLVSLGMLEKDIVLGNTLVDMYAKCGAFIKAQGVLEELSIQDVVTWNPLIAGYAQQGQGEKALKCFDDMLHEGHCPDAITFVCVLQACGSIRTASKGNEIHSKIVSLGMLETDIVLGNALVDMYAKWGSFAKAQELLEELPVRNVVTWNTVISGYAQLGQAEKALKCFDDMLNKGYFPNAVTFLCVLKACGSIEAALKGEEIHDKIATLGILEKDIVLANTLVHMYTKCGALSKAQQVLEALPFRDVVSWNALISGCAQQGQGEEALRYFLSMLHEGHFPDVFTFIFVFKACGSIGEAAKGKEIHSKVANLSVLEKDSMLGNTLVDMYMKCGAFTKAQEALEGLLIRDVVSWNALIDGYAYKGLGEEALKCFNSMLCEGHCPDVVSFACALKACGSIGTIVKGKEIHDKIASLGMLEKDIVIGNTLVGMYIKCGALSHAQQVLEVLPIRDVATWNALVGGYVQHGEAEEALKCFDDMLHEGHCPDAVTFMCVLNACGHLGAATKGKEIHDNIVSLGLLKKDVELGNALVDFYVKCGTLNKAQEVFEDLPIQNIVSWNVLIAGYAEQHQGEEALKCFDDMVCDGHSPDVVTFVCVLKACGSIRAASRGEEIHDKIVSLGMLEKDIMLRNALVDMYVKCGSLAKAQRVFEELPVRDVVIWNVVIAGYAQQGQGGEALKWFEVMLYEGHFPDVVTLICVLKACGSIGAASKGEEIHDKVVGLGMLENSIVVGNSLVNMYAKCSALAKAQEVLEELPIWNVATWNTLIAGFAQQGQSLGAINCFELMQANRVKPDSITLASVLNACCHSGLLDDAETFFSQMSTKYGILPNSEHYCCMVDLFGRAEKCNKALSMIAEIPPDKCLSSWVALLGACPKWRDLKTAELAFKHASHLDNNNAAIYVTMADLYATNSV